MHSLGFSLPSFSSRHNSIHDSEEFDPRRQAALRRHLDEASWREFRSVLSESDQELRSEGLLHFAQGLERSGNLAVATELYRDLSEGDASTPSGIRARAQTQLNAILGVGSSGARAEFLLRRLASEASDPAALAGMVLAGGVYRVTRLATLGRLATSPGLGIFSRGFLARATAATAGFALEAPAFTLGTRATHQILGREVDWSGRALARDFASSYFVLGGLKVAGLASGAAYRGVAGSAAGLSERPLQTLFQQGGMFSGILFGHWLETQAGLRPRQAGATTMVDSLALLLQFNIAGRLASHAMGEGLQARERTLDLQTEALSRSLPRLRFPGFRTAEGRIPAYAGGFKIESEPSAVQDLLNGVQIMQMAIFDRDGKGSRPGVNPVPKAGENPTPTPSPTPVSAVTRRAEPRTSEDRMVQEVDYFLRGVDNPELGLRSFLESLPIAAAVARIKGEDGFGRIFVINDMFTRLFGYNEREAGANSITHFFKLSSLPMISARIHTIIFGGVFKATPMDFRHRDGSFVKIWGSGIVRNIYGENLAFGFYEPREEGQTNQPAVSAPLKVLQAADASRRPDRDAHGAYELKSTIELSMMLARPDSPLMRHFAQEDLSVIVTVPENYDARQYVESLTDGLNVLTRRTEIPVHRRLSVELRNELGNSLGLYQWIKGPHRFESTREVFPTATPATARPIAIPPAAAPARRPGTGLFAEVSRILSGVKSSPESPPPAAPPKDPKKGPDRR